MEWDNKTKKDFELFLSKSGKVQAAGNLIRKFVP